MANYLPEHIAAARARDPKYMLAQQLRQSGSSTAPVGHWLQGAARLAQALTGAYQQKQADEGYEQQGQEYRDALSSVLAGQPLTSLTADQQTALGPQFTEMQLADRQRQQKIADAKDLETFKAGLTPTDTYETVQDPYGRGGVGQRNTRTGKIENYQAPEKPDDPSERQQRIGRIMEEYGVDRQAAVGLVDEVMELVTNPDTGMTMMVNKLSGEQSPLRSVEGGQPGAGQPSGPVPGSAGPGVPSEEENISLWDMTEDVAGAIPTAQVAAQGITGQFGVDVAPEKLTRSFQIYKAALNDLVRAMAVNDRFPVYEQQRIREEFDIGPGLFTDPQGMRGRMRGINDYLSQKLQNEIAASSDASLPAETRRSAAAAVKDIRNFLNILGVPPEGEGSDVADFSAMSLEQLQSLDPSQMSEEELEAAARRFDELGMQ